MSWGQLKPVPHTLPRALLNSLRRLDSRNRALSSYLQSSSKSPKSFMLVRILTGVESSSAPTTSSTFSYSLLRIHRN
jgi:hypothetical protein